MMGSILKPEDFVSAADDLNGLNIECVLAAYSDKSTTIDRNNWQGAMVVSNKTDIAKLLNENRGRLCQMLSIVEEEHPDLRVPGPSHLLWNKFTGVRFAGWTPDKVKKEVKVLSLDDILNDSRSLDLLSFKDERVFQPCSLVSSTSYSIVQQATVVEDNLVIVHEYTVYAGSRTCEENHCHASAVFGVTAHLLIASKCAYGHKSVGALIKKHLLAQFLMVSGTMPSVRELLKSSQFGPSYAQYLVDEFRDLCPQSPNCEQVPLDPYYYGPWIEVEHEVPKMVFPSTERLSRQLSESCDITDYKKIVLDSAFSSNSRSGRLATTDTPSRLTGLFWKACSNQLAEISGSIMAQCFFPRVQHPRMSSTGELVYDWFQGSSQAELRLSYLTSTQRIEEQRSVIIFAELKKAEDTLRAWRLSINENGFHPRPTIHRFFYERLRDCRLDTFYNSGVKISGQCLSFKEFSESPLVINGVQYRSLSTLLKQAEVVLAPDQDWGASSIFGLGDGHGGNVMIGTSTLSSRSREILYVDYEVAGFHSPILDIAKPLYNDVFFNILYEDLLNNPRYIVTSFIHNQIIIDFDSELDPLSRAIFEIKRRYLLQPFCRVAQGHGFNLFSEENMRKLGFLLLACAVLSRNFSGSWSVLFTNIAVGVTISQFTTWKELEDYVSGNRQDY
jgi:hypothetical protein